MDAISAEAQTWREQQIPLRTKTETWLCWGKGDKEMERLQERIPRERIHRCEEEVKSKNDSEMFGPVCAVPPGERSNSACLL